MIYLKVNNKTDSALAHTDSLKSPRHTHSMLRWQVAPGLLKSQAAQVASSTMADGYRNKSCKMTHEIEY